jgi:uncharacterized protein YjbI with pentapeptide repeats
MPNRTSNKFRQLKENLKANKPPTFSSAPNKIWFWLLSIPLASAIGFLVYQSFSSNSPNELIYLIVFGLIALSILTIWLVPKFYVQSLPNEAGKTFDRENAKLKLEDDTRKTFAQIVGGAVLLGGLVFTFNTYRLQVEQVKILTKQQEIAQEGQITDRFTKAVTQIGGNKLEVRLGGLYALERIARDSPKDHWTVIEILSAYVREKAKKNNAVVKDTEGNSNKIVNNEIDETKEIPKITTDVQAALTIIGRRKVEQDSKTDRINLSETDLRGADLKGADLKGADLIGVNLNGANLIGANLIGVDLIVASLIRGDLRGADLRGADLGGADMSGANLIGANLIGADLNSANLNATKLGNTMLSCSDLSDTDLSSADLSSAALSDADLSGANLSDADLGSSENLTFEQLSKVIIDMNTNLPKKLENRKVELLEISKKNREKRDEKIPEDQSIEE